MAAFEFRKDKKHNQNRLTQTEKRALTYEKEPVLQKHHLWEKYPKGGQTGWYCFLIKEKIFVCWDNEINDWIEIGNFDNHNHNRGFVSREPNHLNFYPSPKPYDYVYYKEKEDNVPYLWMYGGLYWCKTDIEMPSTEIADLWEYAKHGYPHNEQSKTVSQIDEDIQQLKNTLPEILGLANKQTFQGLKRGESTFVLDVGDYGNTFEGIKLQFQENELTWTSGAIDQHGNIREHAKYRYYQNLKISQGIDLIQITTLADNIYCHAFYDKNQNFIQAFGNNEIEPTIRKIKIPEEALYIGITYNPENPFLLKLIPERLGFFIVDMGLWFVKRNHEGEITTDLLVSDVNEHYDIFKNPFLIPTHFYIPEDGLTIYKNSLFATMKGVNSIDVTLYMNNKPLKIDNPLTLKINKDTEAKIVIQDTNPFQFIYKDILLHLINQKEYNTNIDALFIGGTSLVGNGDFIPILEIQDKLSQYDIKINTIGTVEHILEYHNQQRKYNSETYTSFGYEHFVGASPTPLTPFLYLASSNDKTEYPQWCFSPNGYSYQQNPNLGEYYIFSPECYFAEHKYTPELILIECINEYFYLNDIYKTLLCAEWMIKRFREISDDIKIIIIPAFILPESDIDMVFSTYLTNMIKLCDELSQKDENLLLGSLYTNISRTLAFRPSYSYNHLNIMIEEINRISHCKLENPLAQQEYINSLIPILLYSCQGTFNGLFDRTFDITFN